MAGGHLARAVDGDLIRTWCGYALPAAPGATPATQYGGPLCDWCADAYLFACGDEPLPIRHQ